MPIEDHVKFFGVDSRFGILVIAASSKEDVETFLRGPWELPNPILVEISTEEASRAEYFGQFKGPGQLAHDGTCVLGYTQP